MSAGFDWDPLTSPPPEEIKLSKAPLVSVVAQIRFPPIAAIERADSFAPFQERLRKRYFFLREEESAVFVVGPGGVQPPEPRKIWRLCENPDGTTGWNVALTRDFLAVDTRSYSSRKDFLQRLEEGLQAVKEIFDPSTILRMGVRYIDQVLLTEFEEAERLLRKEMLGVGPTRAGGHVSQAVSDVLFAAAEGSLRARWGFMAPKTTFDPIMIKAVDQKSFVLDLDAFVEEQSDFGDVADVIHRSRKLAERIYCFFRWAVTDEFLRQFRGDQNADHA